MKKKQTTLVILVVLLLCAAAGAYWFYSNREVPETFFDYSPGDYFVTNVKDSKRLFKVSVVLRLTTDDDKVIAEVFTRNNALIRDINDQAWRADLLGRLVGKGGVVRETSVHRLVLHRVIESALGEGWTLRGLTPSPITGPKGNIEFLVWFDHSQPVGETLLTTVIDAVL